MNERPFLPAQFSSFKIYRPLRFLPLSAQCRLGRSSFFCDKPDRAFCLHQEVLNLSKNSRADSKLAGTHVMLRFGKHAMIHIVYRNRTVEPTRLSPKPFIVSNQRITSCLQRNQRVDLMDYLVTISDSQSRLFPDTSVNFCVSCERERKRVLAEQKPTESAPKLLAR